jgi:hypothetical protein
LHRRPTTIVNVALPTLGRDFGVGDRTLEWVVQRQRHDEAGGRDQPSVRAAPAHWISSFG